MAVHLLAPLLTLLWVPLGEGGNFWHITDIHLDNFYSKSGDRANFCRNSSLESTVIDSGDYQCDSPLLLVKSAVMAMKKFEANPDFILWTGDSNPHWKKDPDGNAGPDFPYIWQNMKTIHKILVESFPNSTLVPVLGNHDAFPADSFPNYDNISDVNNIYANYLKNGTLGDFIPGTSRDTFKRCGYYSRDVLTNKNTTIKLLNLNTNIYYNNPLASGSDPCSQLEWLENELNLAKPSDHIYVTGHVPPGSYERQPNVSFFNSPNDTALAIQKRFIDILRTPKHADKIVAHFYGHIHTDTFRLLKDSARGDQVRGVAFIANSITPILWDGRNKSEKLPAASIGTNPGIRLFQFNDDDASLLEYTQYGLDLDALLNEEFTENAPEIKSRNRNSKGPLVNEKKKKREAEIEASTVANVVNADMNVSSETVNVTELTQSSMTPVPAVPGMEGDNDVTSDNTRGNDAVSDDVDEADKTSANLTSVNERRPSDGLDSTVTVKAIVSEPQPIDSPSELISDDVASLDEKAADLSNKWKWIYNATTSFQVKSLSKKEMTLAYISMMADGSIVFKRYYKHNTNNHMVDSGKCDAKCQRGHLCTITNFLPDAISDCLRSNDTFRLINTKSKPVNPTPSHKPLILKSPTSRAPLKPVHVDVYDSSSSSHKESDGDQHDSDDHEHGSNDLTNDNFTTAPGQVSVDRKPIEDTGSYDGTVKGVGIFLAVAAVAILILIVFVAIRKFRANRYRNQEFLLTDSVFRYDGYNQLDDA